MQFLILHQLRLCCRRGLLLLPPIASCVPIVTGLRPTDHILAAVLKNFVKKEMSWIHVDLAPASKPGGLGHVTTEETGFGVRASLALVLDHWDKITG